MVFVGLFLLSTGCKKADPDLAITAGDQSTSGIIFDSIGLNFNGQLDIDKDGQADLNFFNNFTHYTPVRYDSKSEMSTSGAVYVCVDDGGNPKPLQKGDKIGSGLNWQSGSNFILVAESYSNYPPPNNYDRFTGNWHNVKDRYLAFKIIKNSFTYWGWVKMIDGNPVNYGYIKF